MSNSIILREMLCKTGSTMPSENILVSGDDPIIHKSALKMILRELGPNRKLIIIDDTDGDLSYDEKSFTDSRYLVKNGMAAENSIYPLFPIDLKENIIQLRKLLTALKYDEKESTKLFAYLQYLSELEVLADRNPALSLEALKDYGSAAQVAWKLDDLFSRGKINGSEKDLLLAKYFELCDAGADFEQKLLLLKTTASGESFELKNGIAVVYPLAKLGDDAVLRNMVISMLINRMRETCTEEPVLFIFDKGYGNRQCLVDLIKCFPKNQMHLFSKDFFTINDNGTGMHELLNRFPARLYSRHVSMDSCEMVEAECGVIDVVKRTYTETYDRRWRANRPIDVLWGRNKTQTYIDNAPVREPRYRKEQIACFQNGEGILQYKGNNNYICLNT